MARNWIKRQNWQRLTIPFILILAIGITFAEVRFVAQYATRKLQEQADKTAEMTANSIKRAVSRNFQYNNTIIKTFLAGKMIIESATDSVTNIEYISCTLPDTERKELTVEQLYHHLHELINIDPQFFAAAYIFEPGVLADAPSRGIAAIVRKKDSCNVDLLDSKDIFHHSLYQSIVNNNYKSCIRIGDVTEEHIKVMTYTVPIFNEGGKLIGEFWLDCELNNLTALLNAKKTDIVESCTILDSDADIVASTYPEFNGITEKEFLIRLYGDGYKPQMLDTLKKVTRCGHAITAEVSFEGEQYYNYFFPVQDPAYTVAISISETKTYEMVYHFQKKLFFVSILGLLLITACYAIVYRIHRKKDEENIRIEKELSIAGTIQKDLLPHEKLQDLPIDLSAFQKPARQIGGDLYDYIYKNGKVFFCVGDVAGKGVPAALVMAIASSHFRSIIKETEDPSMIMSHLNNALCDRNESLTFCTLFLGVFDCSTKVLNYCNAGHELPLLKTDNHCDYITPVQNVPLGVSEDFPYQSETLQLKPNDQLWIYTDGVTEAMSVSNEQYGRERLSDLCQSLHKVQTSEEICQQVFTSVSRFTHGAEQSDDITVLVLRTKNEN